MSKKKTIPANFLEFKPSRCEKITWTRDDEGNITLEIENKGLFNKIAQKLFKKPKISYVHLDETGSFVWPLLDGEINVLVLGEKVREFFGEKAEPLYERLCKYLQILESYGFIKLDK